MNETDVIHRCRCGDQRAFEELYHLYAQQALRTAYLISHDQILAENAAQETFVRVWNNIHQLREIEAFRTWFFRILVNTTRRFAQQEARIKAVALENVGHKRDQSLLAPEAAAERNEEIAHVHTAIALLPEAQRLTLILRYYSGLTEAEIAQILGIPVGTVKSRLHTARMQLHEQLSDIGEKRGLPGLWTRQNKEA